MMVSDVVTLLVCISQTRDQFCMMSAKLKNDVSDKVTWFWGLFPRVSNWQFRTLLVQFAVWGLQGVSFPHDLKCQMEAMFYFDLKRDSGVTTTSFLHISLKLIKTRPQISPNLFNIYCQIAVVWTSLIIKVSRRPF